MILLKLFCITDSNVSRKYPHAFGKKKKKKKRCIDIERIEKQTLHEQSDQENQHVFSRLRKKASRIVFSCRSSFVSFSVCFH